MKPNQRVVRSSIQLLFLVFFVYLFIQTRYDLVPGPQDLFFRFDPLILVVLSIAARTVILASLFSVFLVLGTLVFGRLFCGFVCPMGTTLDLSASLFRNRTSSKLSLYNLKYFLLFFLLVAALLGASFLHFFDPLVILERSVTLIFHPVATYFLSAFTLITNRIYVENLIALLLLTGIIGLGIVMPRFWCRNLCPLGGFLALCSRFSLFKFKISDGCTGCNRCEELCPTGAVSWRASSINAAECIGCFDCQYECPAGVITYKVTPVSPPFNIERRDFIATIGASIIAAPLARSLIQVRTNEKLIRPPGAIPEADFLNRCIQCGKCLKICPTNGLQPCLFETGINGLWTPRLVARIGGCEKNCNSCGIVCPTSAIRNLSLEEKSYAKIGTAVLDRSRCLAWEQDKICLICDEACPYSAINSLDETIHGITMVRPFVNCNKTSLP